MRFETPAMIMYIVHQLYERTDDKTDRVKGLDNYKSFETSRINESR